MIFKYYKINANMGFSSTLSPYFKHNFETRIFLLTYKYIKAVNNISC